MFTFIFYGLWGSMFVHVSVWQRRRQKTGWDVWERIWSSNTYCSQKQNQFHLSGEIHHVIFCNFWKPFICTSAVKCAGVCIYVCVSVSVFVVKFFIEGVILRLMWITLMISFLILFLLSNRLVWSNLIGPTSTTESYKCAFSERQRNGR